MHTSYSNSVPVQNHGLMNELSSGISLLSKSINEVTSKATRNSGDNGIATSNCNKIIADNKTVTTVLLNECKP